MAITGADILNYLSDLKDPADISEIVAHLASKNKGSETSLLEAVKMLLEAGVQFGCILEEGNKFRCKEPVKDRETHKDKNTGTEKTAMSNKEMSASSGRMENSANNKRKTINEIEEQQISSEDEDEYENQNDADDAADCYGPSYRRRRSRSRSRRRNKSGKRLSSRRKRRYR